MRTLLLLAGLAAFSIAATAQKRSTPSFTSAYTDMKTQCKVQADPEAEARGQDPLVFCKGRGGYRLLISYSAFAAMVSVIDAAGATVINNLGTDYGAYGEGGEKIEWRMANGKPFALIMRVGQYRAGGPYDDPFHTRTGSELHVKGLPGWEHIDGEIDGALPDANARAHALADAGYNRR